MCPPKENPGTLPGVLTSEEVSPASVETIVYAEFDRGDGLLDVNPWHHFGDAANRPGQCQIARVEVIEIVLNFCRPIVPKGPFETAANCPPPVA